MLAPNGLQHIDQLLNELEELALSEMPAAQFLAVLCERLRYITSAQGALVLLPTNPALQTALVLARSGEVADAIVESALVKQRTDNRAIVDAQARPCWCCVPLRSERWEKGSIVVTFAQVPPEESRASLIELMQAFAEIASVKQLADIEKFLDSRWLALQKTVAQVATSTRVSHAAMALVNHLLPALGAVRISLAERSLLHGMQISAVSGVSRLDSSQDVLHALRQLALQAYRTAKPVVHHAPTIAANPAEPAPLSRGEDGVFLNHIALQLEDPHASLSNSVLMIEWASYADMVAAMPIVSHVLPLVTQTWELQRRWLRVPAWERRVLGWDMRLRPTLYRLLRWSLLAAVAVIVFKVLTIDYPLTVESPAILEPKIKRSVFATADGYVEALLVEDGQPITAGQPVARLKSPALDLQIEELQGQLRSLAERRSGLRVALNQIDASAKDALTQQSRLSAEISQLVAQEANIQKQIKLLSDERAKLALVSPISGIVVSRDLKQQLLMRPVRRGDALFTVVDLEGPWHLRIEVADRDTGYVRSHLNHAKSDNPASNSESQSMESQSIDFVLDSLPEKHFDAQVEWLSDTVQNRLGEGCYLEIRASVDQDIVKQSHMGAGALAYFKCGQQPLWFVWSRPIVEAAQRKFWFWSEGIHNDHAQP